MRAHFGWVHAILSRVASSENAIARRMEPRANQILDLLNKRTQRKSQAFDNTFGTDTYGRIDVPVSKEALDNPIWGYSAINHDFFREIFRAIPGDLTKYTFVDVGSGKGAAVMMAAEFPFRQLIGLELNTELVDVARENIIKFNQRSPTPIAPQWVEGDFFQWDLPKQPLLFFFNNPFPTDLSLQAIKHLEARLADTGQTALLVFRKAPQSTGNYLRQSSFWKPLRLAPYWRVYITRGAQNVQ